MLRTLLIDDEKNALTALEKDLLDYCADTVMVIDKCHSPVQGLKAIREKKPDLVFLDIQYNGHEIDNAFDLLKILGELFFDVIFVSAHEEYAIRAFELNAVHYLTKPVRKEELIKAVDRVIEKQQASLNLSGLEKLIENLGRNQTIETLNICIPTIKSEFVNFNFAEISYCIADGNFTNVYLSDRKKLFTNYSLKKLSELLVGPFFFRAHKEHLIGNRHIEKYNRPEEFVTMKDGRKLRIARRKKQEFERWLGLK